MTTTTIPEPWESKKEAHLDHPADMEPCALCGKGVKVRVGTPEVHVIEGGERFRRADEDPEKVDPAGDMGIWPIGSDCWRRNRKRFEAHGLFVTFATEEEVKFRGGGS